MKNPLDQTPLFSAVQMALHAWDQQVRRAGQLVQNLSEAQLYREVAPGKNRGIYLLGHLVAYHDALGPLLGLPVERAYPEWDALFMSSPDHAAPVYPPAAEMKNAWDTVHQQLADYFAQLAPAEWLARHTAVSAEDFARQPHRNKLNVLLSRTNHLAYHLGQLQLLR